jgi:hypothetical protein
MNVNLFDERYMRLLRVGRKMIKGSKANQRRARHKARKIGRMLDSAKLR